MNAVPEGESDAEAVRATERWYQSKWAKRIIVGVLTAVVVGVLAWGWGHVESETAEVIDAARNGESAHEVAVKNRKRIDNLKSKLKSHKQDYADTSAEIIRRLGKLQQSVNRNRDEYEDSLKELREDLRTIERHHYPRE